MNKYIIYFAVNTQPIIISLLMSIALTYYAQSSFASTITNTSRKTNASTDFANCSESFYAKTAPIQIEQTDKYADNQYTDHQSIDNNSHQQTYPLCFHGFAVMYSAQSRTPIWSAEHLTKERITQASTRERENNFHAENRIPATSRATLADYHGSGYDRGHLAPNGDMATHNQQYDSFSLANIVPQSPYLNRHTWKQIESSTRYLTKRYQEVYTLTGVIFNTEATTAPLKLDNRVSVPSHIFKVVYIPATQQAGVYLAPNDESGQIDIISIEQLRQYINIDPMPALPIALTKMHNLPILDSKLSVSELSSSELSNPKIVEPKLNTANDANQANKMKKAKPTGIWLIKWIESIIVWLKEQISQ